MDQSKRSTMIENGLHCRKRSRQEHGADMGMRERLTPVDADADVDQAPFQRQNDLLEIVATSSFVEHGPSTMPRRPTRTKRTRRRARTSSPSIYISALLPLLCVFLPSLFSSTPLAAAQLAAPEGVPSIKDLGKTAKEIEDEKYLFGYCPKRHTGNVALPDCEGYIQCYGGGFVKTVKCQHGLKFNIDLSICMWPETFECVKELVEELDEDGNVIPPSTWYCPEGFSGRVPTGACLGYIDCDNGVEGKEHFCTTGTLYDGIMRQCTWPDAFQCDVIPAPTMFPTIPASTDGTEEEEIQIIHLGCPPGHTGFTPVSACTEYIYCIDGEEQKRFECADGTLYDVNVGYCTWADQAFCETLRPTGAPTGRPTLSPNDDAYPYYPSFARGVCLNDGRQPPTVTQLYPTAEECCEDFFVWNKDYCVAATATPAPTAAPIRIYPFYPDWMRGICVADGLQSPFETSFYGEMSECCYDSFGQGYGTQLDMCLAGDSPYEMAMGGAAADAAGNNDDMEFDDDASFDDDFSRGGGDDDPVQEDKTFYPDYVNNVCKFDGKQGATEKNLFPNYDECCTFQWIDTDTCLSKKPADADDGVRLGDDAAEEENTGILFYPDYFNNVCKGDGKHSPSEKNLYTTYDACCQFPWIDYDNCMDNKFDTLREVGATKIDDNTVFYPDYYNNVCLYDGKESSLETNLFFTYEDCCNFQWIDRGKCMVSAPAGPAITLPTLPENNPQNESPNGGTSSSENENDWYADLSSRFCKRDGRQNPGTKTFTSYQSCCFRYWTMYPDTCMTKSFSNDTPMPTTSPTPGPTKMPTNTPTVYTGALWYPDINNSRCYADPEDKPSEKTFQSYESCCDYSWISFPDDCKAVAGGGQVADAPDSSPAAPQGTASGNKFYPDYFNNICLNDGKQDAAEVNLFDVYKECCEMGWLDYDTCIQHESATQAVVSTNTGNKFYPDYFENICLNDGQQSPSEANLFDDPDECCEMGWLDYDICIQHARTVLQPVLYYPDYFYNICRADGKQPAGETNLFNNREECCNYEWIDYNKCMSDDDQRGPVTISDTTKLPTRGPTAGPTPPPTSRPPPAPLPISVPPPTSSASQGWYPDYLNNVCRSDGNHSAQETNFFETQAECCEMQWIRKPTCVDDMNRQNVPSTIWYPDYRTNICKNDGRQSPTEVNLYATNQQCCNFPFINRELCMSAAGQPITSRRTPAPTPRPSPKPVARPSPNPVGSPQSIPSAGGSTSTSTGGAIGSLIWYTNEEKNRCVEGPRDSAPIGVAVFPFKDFCCQFSAMDEASCLANSVRRLLRRRS